AGHARGAGADDADLEARRLDVGHARPALADGHVSDEALEAADRDGLEGLSDRADRLALRLLRAHAAADRREERGVGEDVERAADVLLADLRDESGDVDADRAAAHARLVGAEKAAVGLAERVRERVAAGDL